LGVRTVPDNRKPRKGNGRPRSIVGQPSKEPIDRSARDIPPTVDLAATLRTPNGGEAPRCQAVKRDGTQCGAPARKGYRVCARHGAGFTPRPATATQRERKPGGRHHPKRVAGINRKQRPEYAGTSGRIGRNSQAGRRKIAEVVAELEAAQVDLDDSDGEMRVLRGTLAFLLGQADVHEGALDKITGVYAVLERTLTHQTLEPVEARAIGQAMQSADRLLGRSESWVRALLDASRFIVKASKERAETKAKVAEARALETLTKYIHVLRGILWDTISEEELDVIEGRLVREIFAPNGLELEGRDEPLVA
jgi:hypothetical protein